MDRRSRAPRRRAAPASRGRLLLHEILGGTSWISPDWTSLLVGGYALDDLVSAGLPAADRSRLAGGDLDPLEKWNVVAEYMEAARLTGSCGRWTWHGPAVRPAARRRHVRRDRSPAPVAPQARLLPPRAERGRGRRAVPGELGRPRSVLRDGDARSPEPGHLDRRARLRPPPGRRGRERHRGRDARRLPPRDRLDIRPARRRRRGREVLVGVLPPAGGGARGGAARTVRSNASAKARRTHPTAGASRTTSSVGASISRRSTASR